MQEVTFQVDGQTIHGRLFYPEKVKEKNPAILLVHGWNTTQERMMLPAEALRTAGFICMTFDLRGHGRSDGDKERISRAEHSTDCLHAFDFLLKQAHVGPEKVGLVGSSYGAYLAALMTRLRNVQWLAMRVPALYPDEGESEPTRAWSSDNPKTRAVREQAVGASENNALQSIAHFNRDILLVESEKDEQIPHQTIQNYIDAVQDKRKLTHLVMKNTFHSLGTDEKRQEFATVLVDWFEKALRTEI